jgi:hypothetical protein
MGIRIFGFSLLISLVPAAILNWAIACVSNTPVVVFLLQVSLLIPLVVIGFQIIRGEPKYTILHWILVALIITGIILMMMNPEFVVELKRPNFFCN